MQVTMKVVNMVHMLQVANLKTQMEAQKLESIKYLAGGFLLVECTGSNR